MPLGKRRHYLRMTDYRRPGMSKFTGIKMKFTDKCWGDAERLDIFAYKLGAGQISDF
jgi:hypothetical protein